MIRLLNWEFWSFNSIYFWIMPIWFLLCLRARSFFFFSTSNPGFENGGFTGESKKDIHSILPIDLYPPTMHFRYGTSSEKVISELRESGFELPLIGKPDVGGRGRGIRFLYSEKDIVEYARNCTLDYHIQSVIRWPNEVGIFYTRIPGETKGKITGLVKKEFLSITGDGQQTLIELIKNDKRSIMYLTYITQAHAGKLDMVIPCGERYVLSPYGNHARGSLFIDDTHLVDDELNQMMDKLAARIPDFHFGRVDIRYRDWESLKKGLDCTLIEVNGAGSEPTHIYDPRHSLFHAWKVIIQHWITLYKISKANHERGHRYMSFREGINMLRKDREFSKKLNGLPI